MAATVLFTSSAVRREMEITAFSFKQKRTLVPRSLCLSEMATSQHSRSGSERRYFTNATPAGAQIYVGGVTGTIGTSRPPERPVALAVTLRCESRHGWCYGFRRASGHDSGNPVGSEYAPIGEFFNSASNDDILFGSTFFATLGACQIYHSHPRDSRHKFQQRREPLRPSSAAWSLLNGRRQQ